MEGEVATLRASYRLDDRVYRPAYKLSYRHMRHGWRGYFMIVLILMGITIMILDWREPIRTLPLAGFLIGFPFVYLTGFGLGWWSRRELRKMSAYGNEVSLEFTPEEILYKTQMSEGKMKWATMIKAVWDKETILLYPNNRSFVLVPRASLEPADRADEIEKWILAHVPKLKTFS